MEEYHSNELVSMNYERGEDFHNNKKYCAHNSSSSSYKIKINLERNLTFLYYHSIIIIIVVVVK